jgi:prepilin-type N-terminal cleavage/methylation domain-containing protein
VASRSLSALRRRAAACPDDGFTLLEVLIAFSLFAIVVGAATWAIINALNASHLSQQRVDAANVAQTFISSTSTRTANTRSESGATYSASVTGEQFTVKRWITFNTTGATKCVPGSTFTVDVQVFQAQTGRFLARSDSVVAC